MVAQFEIIRACLFEPVTDIPGALLILEQQLVFSRFEQHGLVDLPEQHGDAFAVQFDLNPALTDVPHQSQECLSLERDGLRNVLSRVVQESGRVRREAQIKTTINPKRGEHAVDAEGHANERPLPGFELVRHRLEHSVRFEVSGPGRSKMKEESRGSRLLL
jgi:hypothetical protein